MSLHPNDRVLLGYGEIALLGLFEASARKIIKLERVRELLPTRLIELAEADLGRYADNVFRLRILENSARELLFTTELADLLFQIASKTEGCVQEAEEVGARLKIDTHDVFVALALYAKRLMLESRPPIIEQPDQIVLYLLDGQRDVPSAENSP